MYAWPLIVETYRRKRIVPFAHFLFLLPYLVLIPVLPYANEEILPIGILILFISGLFFAPVLTTGIFSNDISSGRFRILATEPIPREAFYVWRLVGVMLQGMVHLAIVSTMFLIMNALTGLGNLHCFPQYLVATFIMFGSVAALSIMLSLVITSDASTLVVLILPFAIAGVDILGHISTSFPIVKEVCDGIITASKYGLPPLPWLVEAFTSNHEGTWREILGCAFHAAGLSLAYALIGVTLLNRRELKPQRAS